MTATTEPALFEDGTEHEPKTEEVVERRPAAGNAATSVWRWARRRPALAVGAAVGIIVIGLPILSGILSGGGGDETPAPAPSAATTQPTATAPSSAPLVAAAQLRKIDDPFRALPDIHPFAAIIAGEDAVRLRNAVSTAQAEGTQICDIWMAIVGADGATLDLTTDWSQWSWRLYPATAYVGASWQDGTPIGFPNTIAPIPLFVGKPCAPLRALPEPEAAKAQAAAAAAAKAKASATTLPPATTTGQ